MTYIVLDPTLQQREPARFEAFFTGFADGYAKHFGGDEAESTAEWRARIAGKPRPQPVMRIVVAVDDAGGHERVVGGLACEYYRDAACVLVTYLYVVDEPAYRRRGHAKALLAEAHEACSALGPVRAFLAEAEWPELLPGAPPATAVGAARARLHFFAHLGARLLPIDYVQPALGAGKQPVAHLRLFWLPPPSGRRPADDELAAAVRDFLTEFYTALGQESGTPADTATLTRLHDQLAERVQTRHPLTVPLPRLRLEQIALCWHFVERLDGSAETRALLEALATYQCRVLHSMETDLLSRAYRTRRLFRTVCLTKPAPAAPADADAGLAVEIEFPRRLAYQSENRREERWWPLRRRRARAYLAPSFFLDARVVVWNLTVRPDPAPAGDDGQGWLDEQDVIALLKLADDAADQEFVRVPTTDAVAAPVERLAAGIRFRLGGNRPPLDVHGLLGAVGAAAHDRVQDTDGEDAPTPQRASGPAATTVELLGIEVEGRPPFFGPTDRLRREALCGIVTGILDFDRIDDAEARDTLTPSVELDEALLRVHRERLTYVARDDRAARTVAGTVGISPYLVLPHAAVLCDDRLLQPFEAPRPPGRHVRSPGALARRVEALEDALRIRWVPNPFCYPTEQQLYARLLVDGGTEARRTKAEALLLELKTRLRLAREAHLARRETERARFEAIVTGLLGAISVVAFDPLVVDVMAWLRGPGAVTTDGGKLLGHGVTLGLALVCGLAIFLWKRPAPDAGEAAGRRRGRRAER
jgi:GNAT superfamily N-acetyltransferase